MTSLPRYSKSRTARAKRSAERAMQDLVGARALMYNDGRCEICRSTWMLQIAHRCARGRMGEHRASNALLLCGACHDAQRDGEGGEDLATTLGQVLPSEINGHKPNPAEIPVQCVYGRVLLDDEGGYAEVTS